MLGARNWQAGALALRFALLERLRQAPAAVYQGSQIIRWLADFPLPEFPREVPAVKRNTDNTPEIG